jgi:hypothetical protein
MTISPLIFLIVYIVLFAFFVLLSFANFYNVIRFSFLKGPVVVVSLIFLILIVGLVLGTLGSLNDIDWHQPITITLPTFSLPNAGLK